MVAVDVQRGNRRRHLVLGGAIATTIVFALLLPGHSAAAVARPPLDSTAVGSHSAARTPMPSSVVARAAHGVAARLGSSVRARARGPRVEVRQSWLRRLGALSNVASLLNVERGGSAPATSAQVPAPAIPPNPASNPNPAPAQNPNPAPAQNPNPVSNPAPAPAPAPAVNPVTTSSPVSASNPNPNPNPAPAPAQNPNPAPAPAPKPVTTSSPVSATFATLFGACVTMRPGESFGAALAREDATLGHLQTVRVFYPGLPKPWPGPAGIADRPVVVSFKALPRDILAGKDDAALRSWFAGAPRDRAIDWTYYHEPEDNIARGEFTAADYRAAWRHVATLADAAHNPQLRSTLILMNWTLNPASGRTWTDYYPGGEVIDVLGWDAYNDGAKKGRYDDPEVIFGRVVALSKSLGKPWGIAETGSLLTGGDKGGARAAWLHSASAYLTQQGASFVTYFESTVGGDFRLNDKPSREEWSSVVTSSNRRAAAAR